MKLVGIVGGIGPEASNKFCEMLIKHKKKERDQDNIPFIHYCYPQIPDRTEAIMGSGEDPTQDIIKICKSLELSAVDFIVMPCNSAHYFLGEVQENIKTPIVDMTKVLVKKVISNNPQIKKIGILATTGSIKAGIFQNYFRSVGVETILPTNEDQEKLVMEAIYGKRGIKAGKKMESKRLLTEAIMNLIEEGAESIVLGCTEIPLVINQKHFDIKLHDPMEIVAKEIIHYIEREEEEIVTVKYIIKKPELKKAIMGH